MRNMRQFFECVLSAADDPEGKSNPATQALEADGTTVIQEQDTGSRTRFYRLKATPERGGAAQ